MSTITEALMAPMEKSTLSSADRAEVARIATATAKLEIKLAKIADEEEASRWAPIDTEKQKEIRLLVRKWSDDELKKEMDSNLSVENAEEAEIRLCCMDESRIRDQRKKYVLLIAAVASIVTIVNVVFSLWLSLQ